MNAVNMDFYDPNSGAFSDPTMGGTLGGPSFNIHDKRPFWHNGRPWVNKPVFDPKEKKVKMSVAPSMKTNATLMRDEWVEIDRVVRKVARERLRGIQDLESRGLVYNMTNPMGKTILEYQDMDDPGEAEIDMDGRTRTAGQRPKFETKYLPLPIIHSDFNLSERNLQSSRTAGDPLDTIQIETATRRCLEKAEDLLFTDTSFTYGNGTIYSYLSFTGSSAVTLSQNWDASGKTGAEILVDVQNMIQACTNANHYGPFILYIPTAYQKVMGDDYTSGYPKTVRDRLLELDELSDIKVADRLAANTAVLVQMDTQTVRLVNGFAPTVVQWSSGDGLTHHFKVMMIQVPQLRQDQSGQSGVVVLS